MVLNDILAPNVVPISGLQLYMFDASAVLQARVADALAGPVVSIRVGPLTFNVHEEILTSAAPGLAAHARSSFGGAVAAHAKVVTLDPKLDAIGLELDPSTRAAVGQRLVTRLYLPHFGFSDDPQLLSGLALLARSVGFEALEREAVHMLSVTQPGTGSTPANAYEAILVTMQFIEFDAAEASSKKINYHFTDWFSEFWVQAQANVAPALLLNVFRCGFRRQTGQGYRGLMCPGPGIHDFYDYSIATMLSCNVTGQAPSLPSPNPCYLSSFLEFYGVGSCKGSSARESRIGRYRMGWKLPDLQEFDVTVIVRVQLPCKAHFVMKGMRNLHGCMSSASFAKKRVNVIWHVFFCS